MSNKARFVGKVVAVLPTESFGKDSGKPFFKRTIVVTDSDPSDKRKNEVPFEAFGDKCEYLDRYSVGDEVTIDYFPNGRRWDDKKSGKTRWFCSFGISFIKKGAEAAQAVEVAPEGEQADGGDDDVPF